MSLRRKLRSVLSAFPSKRARRSSRFALVLVEIDVELSSSAMRDVLELIESLFC